MGSGTSSGNSATRYFDQVFSSGPFLFFTGSWQVPLLVAVFGPRFSVSIFRSLFESHALACEVQKARNL